MDALRSQIRDIRNHDAECDFDRAVVEITFDALDDEADQDADRDADADQVRDAYEADGDAGSLAAENHGDAELESEQSAGVVDEAFAFENVDDALREAHAVGDRSGGDGVGGGHDGAEDEAEAPVKSAENMRSEDGDAGYGEADQAEGEEEDADDVVFEVAPGSEPGRGVEQRRQEDEEDHVRVQGDVRDAGNEAEYEAGNDQDDGVGELEFASQRAEKDDEEEEQEKDDFDGVDGVLAHGNEVEFSRAGSRSNAQ